MMHHLLDDRELNVESDSDKTSSVQFHKELETDDAVYNLYLKKHTYSSYSTERPDSPDGAYVNFRTKEVKVLKAGTLQKIVEALTPDNGELDSIFVRTFLATYRSFASSKEVIDLLIKRYKKLTVEADVGQDVHSKAVLSFMFIWLDLYPEDFDEPPDYTCLRLLDDFLPVSSALTSVTQQAGDLRSKVAYKLSKFLGGNVDGDDSETALQQRRLSGGLTFSFQEKVSLQRDEEEGSMWRYVDLSFLSVEILAEQLTRMDANLFMSVRPYQCLGGVWNQSGGSRSRSLHCSSVVATIEQFNDVIHRVKATILKDIDLKHSKRAKLVEKWVQVAQQLRSLKNFSSLRAVVSGLQSGAVYRLQKTWRRVAKDCRAAFDELSSIFSEDNNHVISRELLSKEGTAKVAFSSSDRQSKRGLLTRTASKLFSPRGSSDQAGCQCYGTVPYLGTFLTDLAMIDTAYGDYTESGLISFEKRRREFDVLAQLQLYQSAAKLYNFEPDASFLAWFNSCRTYSESESFALSCEIEPLHSPASSTKTNKSYIVRTRSNLFYSVTSLTSLGDDEFVSSLDSSSASSDVGLSPPPLSTSLPPPLTPAHLRRRSSSHSSASSGDLEAIATARSQDECTVRVHLERIKDTALSDGAYKTILVTNKVRAHNVVKTALAKFHLEEADSCKYCLVQILDKKKELQIPDDANVFYAMDNTQIIAAFAVREKPRPATGSERATTAATIRINKNSTFP